VTREREMAIRAALGASQSSLRRQLLAENLILSIFGGSLGIVLAVSGLGLVVTVEDRLGAEAPSGAVQTTAYRIVQEALTNTLKHAGRASASVGVSYRPGEVELSICDDGAAGPGEPWRDAPGHGLIGMRERARLFGGSLDAGPSPTGGFQVRAVLPTGTP